MNYQKRLFSEAAVCVRRTDFNAMPIPPIHACHLQVIALPMQLCNEVCVQPSSADAFIFVHVCVLAVWS